MGIENVLIRTRFIMLVTHFVYLINFFSLVSYAQPDSRNANEASGGEEETFF